MNKIRYNLGEKNGRWKGGFASGKNRKQYEVKWYADNKDRMFLRRKKWRNEHKEFLRAYTKKWRSENKEKVKLYQQKYKSTEKYKLTLGDRQEKNREKTKLYHHERNKRIRLEVLTYYGGNPPKCACCGEKEIAFLAIDHINGGGNKHRKEVHRSITYWVTKNNFPKGFQVLCHNCNMAKGQQGICPHKNKNEHKPK